MAFLPHLSLFLFSLFFVSVSANLLQPLLDSGVKWAGCAYISAGYPVTWLYNEQNDTITVGVSSPTTGYLAIGFNTQPKMVGTDAMIGRYVNGGPTVDDYWVKSTATCTTSTPANGVCIDTSFGGNNNKPILISAQRTSTGTSFVYNRFRVGPDETYDVTVPNDAEIQLVWAIGKSDNVTYHQDRGVLPFYLTNDVPCTTTCSGHGVCLGSCCSCNVGYYGETCSNSDPEILEFGDGVVEPDDYMYGGKLDDSLDLYWNIRNDSSGIPYLDVGMIYSGSSTGWVGFGFSQSSGGHMTPSDSIICTLSSESGSANDRTLLGRDTGDTYSDTALFQADGVQGQDNILAFNTTSEDGQMYCKWRRYLSTGDELDSIVTDKLMKCIYAYSTDSNWGGHSWKDDGRVKVNFYTGEIELEVNLWVIHGGLMFVAWGALIPMASILAKYFKFIGDAWFQTHRIVQTIAILAQTAGFAVVVAAVNREDTSHFSDTHSALGLAVFIFGAIQPFLGQLADFMYDPSRDIIPIFPDKLHWVFGWTAIVLGIINIGLGMDFYESPQYLIILYIVWVLSVALVGAFIHFRSQKWEEKHAELHSPINYDLLR